LGFPAQLIAAARKRLWLVLAGGGAVLGLLILLLILIWLKSGDTHKNGKDLGALDTKGTSDSGKGKDKDKPKQADSGKGKDKDKPKRDPPKVLIDTAFEKGRLPEGWKSDAFRVVEDDDRHCLEVSKESGDRDHFVALPPLTPTLSGNFYIEGEYIFERSFDRIGFKRKRIADIPKLTIELKNRKGNASLPVVIDLLGNITIDDERHTPPPNYKVGEITRFLVTREGKRLSVMLNKEDAAAKNLDEVAEYDTVRVGMPAGDTWFIRFWNSWNIITPKLYSLKIGTPAR
jgi:hypothetical protein